MPACITSVLAEFAGSAGCGGLDFLVGVVLGVVCVLSCGFLSLFGVWVSLSAGFWWGVC